MTRNGYLVILIEDYVGSRNGCNDNWTVAHNFLFNVDPGQSKPKIGRQWLIKNTNNMSSVYRLNKNEIRLARIIATLSYLLVLYPNPCVIIRLDKIRFLI